MFAALEKQVFDEVANLLNLEVDLLFFDTTGTYFELEEPDEPVARDDAGRPLGRGPGDGDAAKAGFRTYGKSKDSRDDLPQIVIGMAVTRDGHAGPLPVPARQRHADVGGGGPVTSGIP
ncbi:hypothetical protein [Streptomyces sp. NPDC058572]|uniref:hypothetical protein n=1 Tax=Streptomyces sp. NPDC058572 TaxID=3346546 RepID=UPI0036620A85